MSLWDLRASGSLKAHSLLLAASMTVKWCRATGAHEMSKNIPLWPCCWTCQAGCQLGNGLSLEEMFSGVCQDRGIHWFSYQVPWLKPSRASEYSFWTSNLSQLFCCYGMNKILSLLSVLSTQNSAKHHHKGGSTQYPKACATSSNPPANLLKAWKGRWIVDIHVADILLWKEL